MLSLSPEVTRQIVDLVALRTTGGTAERYAKLTYALGGNHPLIPQLDLEGNAQSFAARLVDALIRYGSTPDGIPSLWMLLDGLRGELGLEARQQIESWRPLFHLPPPRLPDRVFVSYSRRDQNIALRIVSDLNDVGLRVWFDRSKIRGGEEWWRSIEQGLSYADFVVFCLSPDALLSDVARREISTARRLQKLIVPVMVVECMSVLNQAAHDHPDISWLPQIHILDMTETVRYGDSFHDLIAALPGYNPPDQYYPVDPAHIPSPYRGLEAFREIDFHYFAGRETEIHTLIERVQKKPLLAVMGASGSGKSSLVRAGLIPAMRQQEGAFGGWEFLTFTPGADPLASLSERLQLRIDLPGITIRQALETDPQGLERLVRDILVGKPDTARLVLVIDQAEELFTQAVPAVRDTFIAQVHTALTVANRRLNVILTMRSDFFDRLSIYPQIARLVEDNLFIVTDMTSENLRRSIEVPARKVALQFAEGLIEQLLEDVRTQPGSLPLLQYALKELYERRQGQLLTNEAFRQIGGVSGALATRADGIFNGMTPAEQEVMRRLLLKLIAVTPERVNRRPVLRTEIMLGGVEDRVVDQVIAALTGESARLLVTRSPILNSDKSDDAQVVIEISHEALITRWQRFARWVDQNRETLLRGETVHRAAEDWDANARRPEYLLSGTRLATALEWLEQADSPSALDQTFVQQSRAEQLWQERIRARRNRNIFVGITAALVVMTVLAMLAVYAAQNATASEQKALKNAEDARAAQEDAVNNASTSRANAKIASDNAITATIAQGKALENESTAVAAKKDALAQLAIAENLRLSGLGENVLTTGGDPVLAALAGMRALRVTYTEQADTLTIRAFKALEKSGILKLPGVVITAPNAISASTFSPDGKLLALGDEVGEVHLYDPVTGRSLSVIRRDRAEPVLDLKFSSDGTRLFVADGLREDHIDLTSLSVIQSYFNESVCLGHDQTDRYLLFLQGGTLQLLDQTDPERTTELTVNLSGGAGAGGPTLRCARLSPDGSAYLVVVNNDNRPPEVVWQTVMNSQNKVLRNFYDAVFAPDSKTFAALSENGVGVWDAQTGRVLRSWRLSGVALSQVKYSIHDDYLFFVGNQDRLMIMEIATGKLIRVLGGALDGAARNLELTFALAPDERTVFMAQGETGRMWQVDYQDWLYAACEVIPRDFTNGERRTFIINDQEATCPQLGVQATPMPLTSTPR